MEQEVAPGMFLNLVPPSLPPFGLKVAIAAYTLEVLAEKAPSSELIRYFRQQFLSRFVDRFSKHFAKTDWLTYSTLYEQGGYDQMDEFLSRRVTGYDIALLTILDELTGESEGSGAVVRGIRKEYRLRVKRKADTESQAASSSKSRASVPADRQRRARR